MADPPVAGAQGLSYPTIVRDLLGVEEEFDVESEAQLAEYRRLLRAWMAGDSGSIEKIDALKKEPGARSVELQDLVIAEFRSRVRLRRNPEFYRYLHP